MNDRFSQYYNYIVLIGKLFLISLLTLFVFRVVFLFSFIDFKTVPFILLLKAFWIGLKFDLQSSAYLLLPLLPLSLIVLAIPARYNYYKVIYKSTKIWFWVVAAIILTISMIDYNFYSFFQSRLNPLAFGIFQDDTLAVLESVWTDYPVILITICITTYIIIIHFLLKKFAFKYYKYEASSLALKILSPIVLIGMFFIFMRGSVSEFPLQRADTTVSDNQSINNLTYNGLFALKTAVQDKLNSSINIDTISTLKSRGFVNAKEAFELYTSSKSIYSKTEKNSYLEQNPPNIVFFLMESFGLHYMKLNNNNFDILGSLSKSIDSCYLFKNFTSFTDGTIYTLDGFLVGSPQSPLSQSEYYKTKFHSSLARPFKEKGYETIFITGGKLGWRNLDQFVNNQYFDKVYGKSSILSSIKGSSECEWGVYDEYLFDFVEQEILKKTDKPKMIFVLTTSNHTPYYLPDDCKLVDYVISDSLKQKLKESPELVKKGLNSYRYACNCLGNFIQNINNSSVKNNTIIAATGDHNVKQLFNYDNEDLFLKVGVPFLIKIPKTYSQNRTINTNVWASHKDIFPTLFNLSLSDVEYLNTGNDLSSYNDTTNYYGIYNYKTAFNSNGAVVLGQNLNYYWNKQNPLLLSPSDSIKYSQKELNNKVNAYNASFIYNIQKQIIDNQKL